MVKRDGMRGYNMVVEGSRVGKLKWGLRGGLLHPGKEQGNELGDIMIPWVPMVVW